jgi:hypothetical protein
MPRNDLTLIRLLAFMMLRCGAHDRAQTLYASLRALDADDHEASKGLAWAQIEAGQSEAALNVLDEIVGPGEPGPVVQLLRARAFARLGRNEDAAAAMQAFIAQRSGNHGALRP